MSRNSTNLATLSALNFYFDRDRTRKVIFRDLNLEIRRGEIFVVIGPSGAGKSTLLKIVAGLIPEKSGALAFPTGRPTVSMTFQKSGLFDSLTCGENLKFAIAECLGDRVTNPDARVAEILGEVKLPGVENLRLNEISGGMQKRLGIARGLLLRPDLILYDDPTAGLDPLTSAAILDLIVEVKTKHAMTVMMVTSDLDQGFRIADRVGFLSDGRFLQVGTPAEIRHSADPGVYRFVHGLAPNEEPHDRV